nr:siderophore-interacting protein [Streptomyces sp. ST1015]
MTRPLALLSTTLHVVSVQDLTPGMRRVTFGGDGLADFVPIAPDQQLKLFFARDGGPVELPEPPRDGADVTRWYQGYLAIPEHRRPWMRTYTVRRHLPGERRIEVDFVLHGAERDRGPASRWATVAAPGDTVGMYGPAATHHRTPAPGAVRLLVGDETALPAIGALVEDLAPGERALVYAQVAGPAEEQRWESPGEVEIHWLHRDRAPLLPAALRAARLPLGPALRLDRGRGVGGPRDPPPPGGRTRPGPGGGGVRGLLAAEPDTGRRLDAGRPDGPGRRHVRAPGALGGPRVPGNASEAVSDLSDTASGHHRRDDRI